ncbi:ribonuclease HI [Marispirochaeta aestuarii]|uniref:ribonuclease HI n=1 Tax=Marispirochaeta aestuarii TaxID=1963862 RepID=UPI0029C7D833|nr:ribonuclease HI [Marispirochaeta aestuarii]
MTDNNEIYIYTDGGCWGNPGPGAWAYCILCDGESLEKNGGDAATTNNRMELTAVIEALTEIRRRQWDRRPVAVHTDSQYVKNGITSWIETWSRNGWKTAAKKPVKNQDLWVPLKELRDALNIRWQWVKGHAGNEHNERCDALVQEAIASIQAPKRQHPG